VGVGKKWHADLWHCNESKVYGCCCLIHRCFSGLLLRLEAYAFVEVMNLNNKKFLYYCRMLKEEGLPQRQQEWMWFHRAFYNLAFIAGHASILMAFECGHLCHIWQQRAYVRVCTTYLAVTVKSGQIFMHYMEWREMMASIVFEFTPSYPINLCRVLWHPTAPLIAEHPAGNVLKQWAELCSVRIIFTCQWKSGMGNTGDISLAPFRGWASQEIPCLLYKGATVHPSQKSPILSQMNPLHTLSFGLFSLTKHKRRRRSSRSPGMAALPLPCPRSLLRVQLISGFWSVWAPCQMIKSFAPP
jgi:hypothetical protein